ncbi:caspase family protein [Streptomyces sp. WAC05374]|uniref:caspase family protein n=1 Tax=Streptomyces sp. WAC05374 TaxID=2487420 RepID=UPI000F875B29|nr:caspase family protein [Streptomyces sp. WAC05374]RST15219.1 caspase family protein [Streptomyces sp. WAC05374]TDF41094.1 caspase family protein [Streptomyces sp. WAC05374]TDF49747.1 caspase family protein [Streptomyces sp. WAC05374]TDF51364.1 caspase family protein [Streptomyces sp. WAC05374]
MTRRALLLGARTYDLTGVGADVAVMERLLGDRGFTDLRVRAEGGATYHGMAEALTRLAHDTRPGDAVVVYYSGHGALLPVPPYLRRHLPGGPAHLQYLVPDDHGHSTATDFRGLLAEELTAALRRLTRITPNVTCVLDCCHSGGMVRDPRRWRIKSVPSDVPVEAGVDRSVRLATAPRMPDPDVVRLVACQRHGLAYEYDGQGLFTAGLAKALGDFRRTAVPWSVLISRVREHVRSSEALQRPDAGGPSGRLPFSLDVPEQPERLELRAVGGALRATGGALFGLDRMDRVRLVFPAAGEAPAPTVETQVVAVDGADALLDPPPGPVPSGSYALPVRVHTRHPVHIAVDGPLAGLLRARLAESPRLREAAHEDEARSRVRVTKAGLEVTDVRGLPYRHPWRVPELTVEQSARARAAVALLETVARGERLRELVDPGADGLPGDLRATMEVEKERDGHEWRVFREGDGLRAGDRYRVGVSTGAHTPLYAWLVGVGLSRRTSLVTRDQPSGIRLEPETWAGGGTGWRSGPVEVWWPEDVPTDGERPESVLLLVGDRGLDLGPLGGSARHRRWEPTALRALLDEVCEGVRDSRLPAAAEGLRYRVFAWHTMVAPPSS